VAENYPDLKASATHQNLMKELSDTEARIASANRGSALASLKTGVGPGEKGRLKSRLSEHEKNWRGCTSRSAKKLLCANLLGRCRRQQRRG